MNRCVRCMTSSNTIIYPNKCVCVCVHGGKVAATSHRKLRLRPPSPLSSLLHSLGILCLCVHLSKRLWSESDNLSGVLFRDKPTCMCVWACTPVRVFSVHLRIWVLVIGLCGGYFCVSVVLIHLLFLIICLGTTLKGYRVVTGVSLTLSLSCISITGLKPKVCV